MFTVVVRHCLNLIDTYITKNQILLKLSVKHLCEINSNAVSDTAIFVEIDFLPEILFKQLECGHFSFHTSHVLVVYLRGILLHIFCLFPIVQGSKMNIPTNNSTYLPFVRILNE